MADVALAEDRDEYAATPVRYGAVEVPELDVIRDVMLGKPCVAVELVIEPITSRRQAPAPSHFLPFDVDPEDGVRPRTRHHAGSFVHRHDGVQTAEPGIDDAFGTCGIDHPVRFSPL